VVWIEPIRVSRAGHPLRMVTIGEGPIPALLFGCPHPNEPIGAQMLDFFAHALANDAELRARLPFTWHLIPCVDPDGTRLNEGWFDDPASLLTYTRHYFRPPGHEQVEWTFPFVHGDYAWRTPLPETAAVAAVIERLRPPYVYSLHNCGFGGVYYYLSRAIPALHPTLRVLAVAHDLPLALGEPEVQWAHKLDDAILRSLSQVDHLAHVRVHGGEEAVAELVRSGGSSYDFAVGVVPDVAHLLCEVPYFLIDGIADARPSGQTRGEVFTRSLARTKEFGTALDRWFGLLGDALRTPSPFRSAIDDVHRTLPKALALMQQLVVTDPEMQREATVAERANALYVDGSYGLLTLGMVPRMMAAEAAARPDADDGEAAALSQVAAEAEAMIARWHTEIDACAHYRAVPIQTLVRIEFAAGLRMGAHVAGRAP
jgi:hypothetical protein